MPELTRRSLAATALLLPFAASARAYAQSSWLSGTIRNVEVQLVNLMLGGPDVLRKFLADQMRPWSEVIRENNIKGDI